MKASDLKPCPFCGEQIEVLKMDEEGNIQGEEYFTDPYSGISYGIKHYYTDKNDCPIATHEDEHVGILLYDNIDELIKIWNHRV